MEHKEETPTMDTEPVGNENIGGVLSVSTEEVMELQTSTEMGSEKEVTATQAVIQADEFMGELDKIPDKMAFKIGEVAEILGIQPYVLRYWESEFDELKPKKSNHNQRMYSRNDVKMALMIQKLLHKDRFSIEGARKAIRQLKTHVKHETSKKAVASKIDSALERISDVIQDIQRLKQLFA